MSTYCYTPLVYCHLLILLVKLHKCYFLLSDVDVSVHLLKCFEQAVLSHWIYFRQLVKLQREVMSAETALEQKRMVRHNMLLACKIQDLPIILLSGNLNEISEVQVINPLLNDLTASVAEATTNPSFSLNWFVWFAQLGTDSESTSATLDIYEREAQLIIDYSELEEELTVRLQISL